MNVLDFLPANQFHRVASTWAGEWAGPCPVCGGRDRFRVWPDHPSNAHGGRYMCRQCGAKGDGIQFLRDFGGLSFREACEMLRVQHSILPGGTATSRQRQTSWSPRSLTLPCELWQVRGASFVEDCSANMADVPGRDYAQKRHLKVETCLKLGIGWNPDLRWEQRSLWGVKETGKGLPLPAGLVIPNYRKAGLLGVNIRRNDWSPTSEWPKYQGITGSVKGCYVLGKSGKPVVVLESELDAALVYQEANDLCAVVALGTVYGKPDLDTNQLLQAASTVIVALDYDQAGKQAWPWWEMNFKHASLWSVPVGKDVGDMVEQGYSVREWIMLGINEARPGATAGVLDLDAIASEKVGQVQGQEGWEIVDPLLLEYPNMAPCPMYNGNWVYRGQSCVGCASRQICQAWPKGMTFDETLPEGIVFLRRNAEVHR